MKTTPRFPEDVAALALTVVVVGTLVGEVTNLWMWRVAAQAASVAYAVLMIGGMGRTGRIFLTLSALLIGAILAVSPTPIAALDTALTRACFVTTLFVAVGTLREAAQSSPMVRRCGLFLARQRPGRRYLALTFGGHLFGLILNYGAISLLGTMSARSNAAERDDLVRRLRLRRMLLAVQRGFTSTLTWSPLSLSTAVILSVFPAVHWESLVPFTLTAGVGLAVLGWAMDRMFKPTGRPSSLAAEPPPGGWHLLIPIAGLVLLVFATAMVLKEILDIRMVLGVMLAVPAIAIAWIFVQFTVHGAARALRLTGRRIIRHGRGALPAYRNEVALLWSAAVIGSAIAALLQSHVPGGDGIIAPLFAAVPWLLPITGMWLIVIAGQLGMNPILSVTMLSGLIPDLNALGVPAIAVAVALTAGWSLTGASSPFTATTVLVGRIAKTSPAVVGARWNGAYTLVGLLVASLYVAGLTVFLR